MTKIKVLFLAANPLETKQLQLDEEIREITRSIRESKHRDLLEIIPLFAVRTCDLLQGLLEHKPHIVHFSGHGSTVGELMVVENPGQAKPISKDALTSLFDTLRDNIRVVLLNACHTQIQADAISCSIDCTIGMNKAIGDRAAIVFAASFYGAIGFGRSLEEAFNIGKASLLLEGIPEHETPALSMRGDVKASEIVLISPTINEIPDNPIFQPIWDRLDENLQDAIVLAATAAHRDGKDYISTKTLFASLRRLHPEPLPDFFSQLPEGALPEPIPADVAVDTTKLNSISSLSPCVESSLSNLAPKASPRNRLSSEHIFVDIARHGGGRSTLRLRQHGFTKEVVEEIVRQLGWQVIERT